ncbi:unnamed protein product, partial [Allacma fusca]
MKIHRHNWIQNIEVGKVVYPLLFLLMMLFLILILLLLLLLEMKARESATNPE